MARRFWRCRAPGGESLFRRGRKGQTRLTIKLVVDTCVARSAGIVSEAPESSRCREALNVVMRKPQYRLVFTPQLVQEWMEHESNFSKRWRSQMTKRNRILKLSESGHRALEKVIQATVGKASEKKLLLKDIHLISGALNSDRRILSRDEAVRALFIELSPHFEDLTKIICRNPVEDSEKVVEWLNEGARVSTAVLLCKD